MSNFRKQKELASRALGISKKRLKINAPTAENKKSVKELISREGVKDLVEEKLIVTSPKKGNSRTRANHIASQKKKGRRTGHGHRKGTANARDNEKGKWMTKIRSLRAILKRLKDNGKLETKVYRDLYLKAKGNFFRNKKHMMLIIEQGDMIKSSEGEEKVTSKPKKVKSAKEVEKDEK